MPKKWPKEVVCWLRDHAPGRTTKELTALINAQGFDEKYSMTFTESLIKGAKCRYGFKSGTPCGLPKGYSHKYPPGMEEYIQDIAEGKTTQEIAEAVSKHFGIEFTTAQCKTYKANHNIVSGLDCRFQKGLAPANKGCKMSPDMYERCAATMFKKGSVPANHKPVGTESIRSGKNNIKTVYIKVAEPNKWRTKNRVVWEKYNGPIPQGKVIVFADGDPLNTSIENLIMINRSELAVINHSGCRGTDAESMRAVANIAALKIKIAQKKNKGKN